MGTQNSALLLDILDAFLEWWDKAHELELSDQITAWHDGHMATYPELRRMQVADYAGQGHDWRDIAAQRIFPFLPDWLPAMRQARSHLLVLIPQVCRRAEETLGMEFVPLVVLYVGIGCGAGWATRYQERPACLMGLEMIAQSNWHTPDHLEGLLAHELGHLLHMAWRDEWETFAQAEKDPLFLLYSEGFAQRCEGHILGQPSWHMVRDEAWLDWCQENLGWLAGEFLSRVQESRPVQGFFGSWFEIRGRRQTGYFLGHAWVQDMERDQDLHQVALLPMDEVRRRGLAWLQRVAP